MNKSLTSLFYFCFRYLREHQHHYSRDHGSPHACCNVCTSCCTSRPKSRTTSSSCRPLVSSAAVAQQNVKPGCGPQQQKYYYLQRRRQVCVCVCRCILYERSGRHKPRQPRQPSERCQASGLTGFESPLRTHTPLFCVRDNFITWQRRRRRQRSTPVDGSALLLLPRHPDHLPRNVTQGAPRSAPLSDAAASERISSRAPARM